MTTSPTPTAPESGLAIVPESDGPTPVVAIRRRTIDTVLIGLGAVAAVVFGVAGGLLTWGSNFADDYVGDELASQQIFFPGEDELADEGRDDLLSFADEQVTTGDEAEAYASFINGHLQNIAGGATYSELGDVQSEARDALAEATEAGASDDEIAELQTAVDDVTRNRETLFKGETLRGLLLSTYAWSTIGNIAGIAATVAFVAAGVMAVLVAAGLVHLRRAHRSTT